MAPLAWLCADDDRSQAQSFQRFLRHRVLRQPPRRGGVPARVKNSVSVYVGQIARMSMGSAFSSWAMDSTRRS
jgi:hypothetical protein